MASYLKTGNTEDATAEAVAAMVLQDIKNRPALGSAVMAVKKQPEGPSVRATSYEVARHAGLSQSPISHCFKQCASVVLRNLERIRTAARGLNYSPNSTAQGQITRRSNLVAIIISELTKLYYPEQRLFAGEFLPGRSARLG